MAVKKTTKKEIRTIKKIGGKMIDMKIVEEMAGKFCTVEEIADIIGIEPDVLKVDERFNLQYRKSYAEAKKVLRDNQFKLIEGQNATIVIWLGKIYLGQKEKESSGKELDYDLTKLPDFYLQRIIKGEDYIKVINEFENARAAN